MGKKSKTSDNEFDEIEELDNSSHQGDATDNIDISGFRANQVSEKSAADSDQPKSLVDKLKAKFLKGSVSVSADPPKKNTRLLFQVALVVIAVGVMYYDDIFPPGEVPAPEIKLKPRPKPVKKTESTEQAPTAEVTETPVTENVTSATETNPESAVEVTSNAESVPTETANEPVPDTMITETPTTETPVTPETILTEPAVAEEPVLTEPAITDPVLTEPAAVDTSTATVDQIDDSGSPTLDEGNVTDKILQDLEKQVNETVKPEPKTEYTTPPDYDYRGRGLVYNCVGKHWACVDAPSYKTCEDNSSSVKFLNKKTECYPFNVYETLKGCQNMQNRMVSSSAKTSFCND